MKVNEIYKTNRNNVRMALNYNISNLLSPPKTGKGLFCLLCCRPFLKPLNHNWMEARCMVTVVEKLHWYPPGCIRDRVTTNVTKCTRETEHLYHISRLKYLELENLILTFGTNFKSIYYNSTSGSRKCYHSPAIGIREYRHCSHFQILSIYCSTSVHF